MTRPFRAGLGVLALLTFTAPAMAQQSLTIYSDGRVLVRREFPVAVPRGSSTQRIEVGPINPATVFPLDPGVAIARASFDGAVDEMSVLRRAVGRTLSFVNQRETGADTVRATVIGVDPLRLRLADGSVTFHLPGQALYPADLVVTDPTLALSLTSASARQALGLGYFTQGARWQAAYSVVLSGSEARVTGQAAVESGQLSTEDAELQLLAGNVGSAGPERPPVMYARAQAMEMDAAGNAAMAEQSVGEFHLYSLPGTHDLRPGETLVAALFEPGTTTYRREYVVRGGVPYWGMLPQTGDEGEVPVEITYTLERERGRGFGEAPLPGGVARLYEADAEGRLQLTGEARIDHTPAGEDLAIRAGSAFDLTARRVQTSYTTERDSTRGRWRTSATADYTVTLTNAKDEAVTVIVEERRGGEWTVLSSSVPAEKVSSSVTRFRVEVPARGEATLTYRIRARW